MDTTASVENFASEDDSNAGFGNSENRERDRERRNRNQKGTRFSDADKSETRDRSREGRNCRIYVSNIPYDYRWQDLKDLFRRVVGSVEYVELFQDENGKARGCGIVEFKDPDNVEKALEKMNRYDINGREIVVKEDHGENRDQCGRIIKDGMTSGGGGGGGRGGRDRNDSLGGGGYQRRGNDKDDMRMSGSSRMSGGLGKNNVGGGGMLSSNAYEVSYNTYGLSSSFLESLGIFGPLHTKIFVANLDYKVDSKKLKQVFKLAGRVLSVDLSMDKEGNSRGFAVIEYEHPVEAVQAISMFDCQMLYERRMTVRLDRIPDKTESLKLPDGLGGIGIGLGPNGEPLRDVAKNLPNIQQPSQVQDNQKLSGSSGSNMVQPVPVAAPPINQPTNMLTSVPNQLSASMLQGLTESNLVALTNALGVKNLSSLSNPLLTSSLSSLGLNLTDNSNVHMKSNIEESINSSMSSNNYNAGNNYSTGYSSTTFSSGNNNIGRGDYDNNLTRKNFNTINQSSQDFASPTSCMFGGVGVGGGGGGGGGGGTGSSGGVSGVSSGNAGGAGGGGLKNTGVYQSGSSAANGGRKSDTIIIRNIPISCTWQTLRDKFRDIGEVKFAEIRGNDVGVVRFFKENDAELAIKIMDGSRIEGRTVSVTFF